MKDIRETLRKQINVVPEAVKKGGVMTTTLWKQKAHKAQLLLKKPKATNTELETALFELINFK